jgi:hypothetical protein
MDWLFVAALIANIFALVYFRLMVGYYRERATGERDSGFLAAISYPSRRGLPEEGLRYWRRYWWAIAALAVLVTAALVLRLPHLTSAFAAG